MDSMRNIVVAESFHWQLPLSSQ
jgi:hypothetical protein